MTDKQMDKQEIKEIIDRRVDTNLGQVSGTRSSHGKGLCDVTLTVSTSLIAEAIVEKGYGNIERAIKAFAEEVKKELNDIRIEIQHTKFTAEQRAEEAKEDEDEIDEAARLGSKTGMIAALLRCVEVIDSKAAGVFRP